MTIRSLTIVSALGGIKTKQAWDLIDKNALLLHSTSHFWGILFKMMELKLTL